MPEFTHNFRGAGNLSALRRCLFVLLLVVVPFQFAWSAASTYCGHEDGAGASHFGHHQHHAKAHLDDKTQNAKLKQIADGDDNCISCHVSLAQQSAGADLPVIAMRAISPADTGPRIYRSPIPPGLERPARRIAT